MSNKDIGVLLGYDILGESKIINNIIWGNKNLHDRINSFYIHNPDITYSCIENGWSGEINIDSYLRFLDISVEDFHLLFGSPCINTANPIKQYNDLYGSRNNMVAYESPYDVC